jgi:hypothetical protein
VSAPSGRRTTRRWELAGLSPREALWVGAWLAEAHDPTPASPGASSMGPTFVADALSAWEQANDADEAAEQPSPDCSPLASRAHSVPTGRKGAGQGLGWDSQSQGRT